EEQLLYPVLKQEEETRDITFEGIQEHHVVKVLLREMEAMPVDSETWTAKLAVLKESVEHHVEEEEGDMFPKASKALSKEKIDEMGARIEAAKKQLSTTATAKG